MTNPIDSVRRKLQGLGAMLRDPAATEHEKANAAALKAQLEEKLKDKGVPAGDWSDIAFRAGKALKTLKQSTEPPAAMNGTTGAAFRLGKAFSQARKKLKQPAP